MLGIFDMPDGFPDIRFDWVTEEDLRERIRVEASAPGTWEMTGNRFLSEVSLKAEIHKYAPHELSTGTLTGKLLMGNHLFPVTYHFPGPFQFTIELERVAMEHLINPVAIDAGLFQWLPALFLRDAKFIFSPQTGHFSLSAKSDDTWTIPVGRDGVTLNQLQLELLRQDAASPVLGKIEGTTMIGGRELNLSAPVDKPSVLLGSRRPFDLPTVLAQLCDDAPIVASSIKPLTEAAVQANLADQSFSILGSPPDSGTIRVSIYRHEGKWGFVATPEMLRSWRISDLAAYLHPLDRIDITRLMLVVTSFERVPWDVPGLTHEMTNRLRRGTNLVIPTRLVGLPEFELLSRLYGSHDTPITFVGNVNPERLSVQGTLPHLMIASGVTFLEPNATLTLSANGSQTVDLDGLIHLQVGRETLSMNGELKIRGKEGNLSATLNDPWKNPFSTQGIVIHHLSLTARMDETARPSLVANGRAALRGQSGSVRVYQMHSPEYDVNLGFDRVPTTDLFAAIIPKLANKIPVETQTALSAGFHDVSVRLASNGNELQTGFRFLGQAGLLTGTFDQEKGITAAGAIDAIRRQRVTGGRHILELTAKPQNSPLNSGPQYQGPLVRMSPGESGAAHVEFEAVCTLFAEFSHVVFARMTKRGAEFSFDFDSPEIGFDLACIVTESEFTAEGDLGLQLKTEFHLHDEKTGADLGRVHVDAPFHAKLHLSIGAAGFEARLNGHLLWNNLKLPAPKLVLSETPVSFDEFRQSVAEAIRPHAFSFFKPAFAESGAFHAAVKDGQLVTGQSLNLDAIALAQGMRQVFNADVEQLAYSFRDLSYSSHDIAKVLKTVARVSPEVAAKQLHAAQCSSNQIGSALKAAYDAKPEIIAQSLRAIGFGYQPIAEALRLGAGFKPGEVASALKAASFDAGDIALALRDNFRAQALDVARALRQAGIKSKEAIVALPPVFETNLEETETLLIAANYSPRDVRGAAEKSSRFFSFFG
tara:strand:- start:3015 stop:5978 length:2964 start_codon:yes stop_codon:yes gene_type:complete